MHKFAFSCDKVDFDYSGILEQYQDLINYYFLEQKEKSLKIFSGFFIHYEHGFDQRLDLHTDDSDITFNLCLGDTFEGSNVIYVGSQINKISKNPKDHGQDIKTSLLKGLGQIFRGRHPHYTEKILNGSRWNLVLWCKYK